MIVDGINIIISIAYFKQKSWLRIHIMQKLKFKLDLKSLETIYLVFIDHYLNTVM